MTLKWLVATHLVVALAGGVGGAKISGAIGDGIADRLSRENSRFRDTISTQRDRNLELETGNAELETAALADQEADSRNLERIGLLEGTIVDLADNLDAAEGHIALLERGAESANAEIDGAFEAVGRIEAIIAGVESRAGREPPRPP